MPQIERIISRGQLVGLTFIQDAVAASQTDAQLQLIDATAAAASTEYCMPFAGEVIGVSYALTAAGTTGTFTIGATIAGTEVASSTLTVGTNTKDSIALPRGTAAFDAEALIGAEITTGGTWDGTTADLVVTVWVLLYIDGI